jgi:hypothetical protein
LEFVSLETRLDLQPKKFSWVDTMTSIYYSAARTDSGFLLGCPHEHETIAEADSCIPCAGGYVVGVENGVMRSLTAGEETEFQRVRYVSRLLEAYGVSQPPQTGEENRYSHVARKAVRVRSSDFVGFVLDWLNRWEARELERMCALQVPVWLEVLWKRARRALRHEAPSGR